MRLVSNIIFPEEKFTPFCFRYSTMCCLVVFEVSGVQAGVSAMTQISRVRGRIVMVAIHSEPKAVDLFRFFWREIKLIGARVYEPEDFDEAIALAASGALPLEKIITQVSPLSEAQAVFETIDNKTLLIGSIVLGDTLPHYMNGTKVLNWIKNKTPVELDKIDDMIKSDFAWGGDKKDGKKFVNPLMKKKL